MHTTSLAHRPGLSEGGAAKARSGTAVAETTVAETTAAAKAAVAKTAGIAKAAGAPKAVTASEPTGSHGGGAQARSDTAIGRSPATRSTKDAGQHACKMPGIAVLHTVDVQLR